MAFNYPSEQPHWFHFSHQVLWGGVFLVQPDRITLDHLTIFLCDGQVPFMSLKSQINMYYSTTFRIYFITTKIYKAYTQCHHASNDSLMHVKWRRPGLNPTPISTTLTISPQFSYLKQITFLFTRIYFYVSQTLRTTGNNREIRYKKVLKSFLKGVLHILYFNRAWGSSHPYPQAMLPYTIFFKSASGLQTHSKKHWGTAALHLYKSSGDCLA